MRRFFWILAIFIVILMAGCSLFVQADEPHELPQPQIELESYTLTPSMTPTREPTRTPTLTLTPTPTPYETATLTPTLSPTVTLSPTPTPNPYADYFIESLAERNYGGGVIQDAGDLNSVGAFTRKLFKYRSEGLNLYGFIDIPDGAGPFPVVVMLHGYVSPDEYKTLDYSTRYADALAEEGFIVVHPNLRGYAPSATGENYLGISDTVDVLNLISLLRSQAGSAGILKKADAREIGLWGHSMGGGIVLRILIVDKNIDAALLYASVNANETVNLAHFDDDGRGNPKIKIPEEDLAMISPLNYLDQINAPISIHHGKEDSVIPYEWSLDLCDRLEDLGVDTSCSFYPNQPHTFQNSGDTEFIANMVAFFKEHLKLMD